MPGFRGSFGGDASLTPSIARPLAVSHSKPRERALAEMAKIVYASGVCEPTRIGGAIEQYRHVTAGCIWRARPVAQSLVIVARQFSGRRKDNRNDFPLELAVCSKRSTGSMQS